LLKLKKIQILGFKSFCDKTEVVLPGNGIAVVVGPNGCGKSNILDGVTWVLGEQSAKSLRGGKMEDVIFAGTRDRRSLGMAEVSITLIDPDVYGAGPLTSIEEPEVVIHEGDEDWDEARLRQTRAEEVDQIIAEAQPGQVIEGAGAADGAEGAETTGTAPGERAAGTAEAEAGAEGTGFANEVVLKIRRRKFQKTPQHGEIVVTRRLFRTGDSEYLLNGKLCRLSDIRDIFMGTGLGPESYAIIGQERIGQLLSSKPHDRRAIIEEAAGITRFKTKKRLAELRLEQARQNLARIDDIFDEVTRQMAILKRQAAKAERYGVLRDELRGRLQLVLAGKLRRMDTENTALTEAIAALTTQVDAESGEVEQLQQEVTEGQQLGYTLDAGAKEQSRILSESGIELERARNRQGNNMERLAELQARTAAAAAELSQARDQLQGLKAEREQQQQFLQTAAGEAERFRAQVGVQQAQARDASAAVGQAEGRVEAARREATQLLQQMGQVRGEKAQAEESLAALERDAARLGSELETAKRDLEALGVERGQVSMRFESAAESLKRLESEIAAMRAEVTAKRGEEQETRQRGDRLRSERATLTGRCNSLDALLREHSYSTDTVKKLFRASSLSGNLKPAGTLADFLEVGQQYESVVDEFLRDELNYVVVRNWESADEGVRLLKGGNAPGSGSTNGVDGRATFLVVADPLQSEQEPSKHAGYEHPEGDTPANLPTNVIALTSCIRIQQSLGASLPAILPRLRLGYIAEDAAIARSLALEHPQAFFLAPGGECFHNVTVTGGKPRAEGPLALKRELRDAQTKLAVVEEQLGATETQTAMLTQQLQELTRRIDTKSEERRHAERESAQESAALRQMDGEKQRLERRVQDYGLQGERARTQRDEKAGVIARKAQDAERLETAMATVEATQASLAQAIVDVRARRDTAQAEAAQAQAELAGLEERRRGAQDSFSRIDRMYAEGERRSTQLDQQLAGAAAETTQREEENAGLAAREAELRQIREAAETQARQLTEEARGLRGRLAEVEAQLKTLRASSAEAREQRSQRLTAQARLAAELGHVAEACVQDLGVEADALRAQLAAGALAELPADQLSTEEEACREMKRRLEAMGPVNMMALEEFRETETRHGFLETQRKDLLDSIENTRSTIKELDGISRTKFDEAFVRINENFSQVFARLFGGGQATMRLTDEENSNDSGIDIVAQPPGKKLQNVFLLSGGEKALTALSLLMGIFQFQPAPFCVLDEVDAPLDETNVGRLADMLRSMATDTQFVMVTHSKRMMTAADLIYGVTMQEPGVSKVVSVRLHNGESQQASRPRPQRELALA
jgi:chromosome segregation protein